MISPDRRMLLAVCRLLRPACYVLLATSCLLLPGCYVLLASLLQGCRIRERRGAHRAHFPGVSVRVCGSNACVGVPVPKLACESDVYWAHAWQV